MLAEWDRQAHVHEGDAATSESDPFEDDEDEDAAPGDND
jgi:hypothetical protein